MFHRKGGIFIRILAISDIHGCYDELIELLYKIKFDKNNDQLVLLGDYEDRGFKSKDVINKIIKLSEDGAITLRGNHDQMFLDWLVTDNYLHTLNFFRNGGFSTLTSYVGYDFFEQGYDEEKVAQAKRLIHRNFNHHIEFLRNLNYYYETPECIFVHAGINPHLKDWKNTTNEDLIWIRDQFLNHDHSHDKIIIHGHTPTINLHGKYDIYFNNKKIGIDGACAYGGQLNCLEINNGEFKQHHVVRKGGN